MEVNNPVLAQLRESTGPGEVGNAQAADELQDRFMTLLITQIKNQDPLNPLDNAEVTSQLAQLNMVGGIERSECGIGMAVDEAIGIGSGQHHHQGTIRIAVPVVIKKHGRRGLRRRVGDRHRARQLTTHRRRDQVPRLGLGVGIDIDGCVIGRIVAERTLQLVERRRVGRMVALQGDVVTDVALAEAVAMPRGIPREQYDAVLKGSDERSSDLLAAQAPFGLSPRECAPRSAGQRFPESGCSFP